MNPYAIEDLAVERQRLARCEAARARLAAVARCCKPSELARIAAALRGRLVRTPAACC